MRKMKKMMAKSGPIFLGAVERLADEEKEEGNQLYKLKQYRDALAKYSEAIDLCPQCVSFYGNRSACYLMLGQPRQALEDAKTSTNLDPEFTKGWTRVARCCNAGRHCHCQTGLNQAWQLRRREPNRTE